MGALEESDRSPECVLASQLSPGWIAFISRGTNQDCPMRVNASPVWGRMKACEQPLLKNPIVLLY